jgi:KAP-like P-loop domain-containing protein
MASGAATSSTRHLLTRLRAPIIRVALVTLLASVVFLLAVDRLLIPGWLHWLTQSALTASRSKVLTEDLSGLFPMFGLILLVFIANPIYAWLPPLGWLVPTTALAAMILLIIDIPKTLGRAAAAPLGLWVRLSVALLLAILLTKFLLLHRHAIRGHSRVTDEPPPLLPSQKADLKELQDLITDQRLGRVLPLEGRLGEGKSFLVRWLKHEWSRQKTKPVVVVVDVWQQQTESDLQAAILEALFSNPAFMASLGWLQVPASFFFARWIAAIHGLRSSIELRLRESKAGFELDLDIPGLRWQSHFERATARMVRAGRSTVIVLDEIDRATPAVAQAALTLARRSVDVPGVTVLIPYIRSLIRYKVFNPLQPVLPDLGSSMDAILYEERFSVGSSRALGGDPTDTILKTWEDLRERTITRETGLPPEISGSEQLTQALRLGVFANAEGRLRERLQERFEEKYLGAAALVLHAPKPEDLAAMVVRFSSLRRRLECVIPRELDKRDEVLEQAVEEGLRSWLKSQPQLVGPPLRVLEGALYRIFQEAAIIADGRQLSPQDVATLAVAAYDAAGLVHGATGTSP